MKKLILFSFLALVTFFFLAPTTSADILFMDHHEVYFCVKIVNMDDYSEITLLSSITGPMIRDPEVNEIEGGKCLNGGYKFNSMNIYWQEIGMPNVIEDEKILIEDINLYGGSVKDKNPLLSKYFEYSLDKKSDGKYILYKSKETWEYRMDKSKKVFEFTSPIKDRKKLQDFWQSIMYFFKGLFRNSV